MDPAYKEVDVAKKIAEVYYPSNRFHLTEETHVPGLIKGDPFNTGTDPGKFLRRLTVLVDLPRYGSSYDVEAAKLLKLLTNLLPLTLIDRKDRLEVEIRIITEYDRNLDGARVLNLP
jgi:hypothetical protein